MTSQSGPDDIFPPQYTFPPFFTRQPNETTWAHQRATWAQFILAYCRRKKLWRLNVWDALETEMFWNKAINRRLKHADALAVLDHMAAEGSIEWDKAGASGRSGGSGNGSASTAGKTSAIVWWRKPEEWATLIHDWVDSTGQKNAVLTLYEIAEGDLTTSQEFHGMDPYMVRKAMEVLTKRGVAQVFSINGEFGVKFF
ncbi:ESCRT-II complex subunit-domain-containing protein [Kalaharituber pfeilii]|nr:ESCRT-II complex subunit-domain-containing protein [Kalaharituber pfeilii]